MRVLMLGWELPPFNSGGLGVACLQMSRALAASGADIDFVLPYYKGEVYGHMNVISMFDSPNQIAGLPNAYEDSGRGSSGGLSTVGLVDNAFESMIARIAFYNSYDIIHAHDWLTFRAALRAKWALNKPLVLHVHSIERDRAGGADGNPLVREIEATALTLADQVVAVSKHTKEMIMQDYGIPADKIAVIHNAINVHEFTPLDTNNAYAYLEYMKADSWQVLAYVGRLTVQKGLVQLIHSAAEAMSRCPKTFMLIVGSGEQRDELLALAADHGIADRCFFVDFQRGRFLRDAYRIADLFIMPSVSEPFGLAALEAAGFGVPVLVSKQSGVSEALKACLRVDFWDINEMANQITAVLQNPALGAELSSSASRELANLSWSGQAKKLMRLYGQYAGAAS